jgi:hypothetical protein
MNWDLLTPLLVTTVVAIVGWFAAHRLSAIRDQTAERRKLRVQHLMDAYRRLEPYGRVTPGNARDLEQAIADIQLLGSREQVLLAQNFAAAFAQNGTAPLDPLLISLRTELRSELNLPTVKGGLKYLRVLDPRE